MGSTPSCSEMLRGRQIWMVLGGVRGSTGPGVVRYAIGEAVTFLGPRPSTVSHLGRLCRDSVHPASQAVEVVLRIAARCEVVGVQRKHLGDLTPYRRPLLSSSSVLFGPLRQPQESLETRKYRREDTNYADQDPQAEVHAALKCRENACPNEVVNTTTGILECRARYSRLR
jgi:hypothetical protein